MTTTGVSTFSAAARTVSATAADGGLETRTTTSVAGSSARACSPCSIEMPPTSSDRSWPPVPRAWETPAPSWWTRTVTSWVPVPEAPTTPIGPRRTTLGKPGGSPLTRGGPAPDDVGEAERDAVDDGGAAVGAHHHEAVIAGVRLQLDLVGDGDVVAEDHDVETEPDRLHRLRRRVVAGYRDQGEVAGRVLGDRHGDARDGLGGGGAVVLAARTDAAL